jgi:FMN phosphatase YigB (HAD superfamily)
MKAILFDFGGTIDTNGVHWSEKFWDYYQRYRVHVAKERFEKAFVTSEKELGSDDSLRQATFYATLLKQFNLQFAILGVKLSPDGVLKIVNACYADVGRTIADAKKVLKELQGEYRMGVVSNFYGNLDVVCAEFGLDQFFEVRIDSVLVGMKKPDPGIFQTALDRLDVEPKDTFVVGDSYDRDIVPGRQLGCTTIWLQGKSWTAPPSTEAADFTIQKFEDIITIIPRG